MNSKATLRPFTQDDWYAWAGATRFPTNEEPLMATSELGVLIVDAEGVGLYFGDEDFDTGYFLEAAHATATKACIHAEGICRLFGAATSNTDLEALVKDAGFRKF